MEKIKKKSYRMMVAKATLTLRKGVREIKLAYDRIKEAKEKIRRLEVDISHKRDELLKVYKANKAWLPESFIFKYGSITVTSGKGKVAILKGFAKKITDILDELRKYSIIRRRLSIIFKASPEQINRLHLVIERFFEDEKIQDYQLGELKSEVDKDEIRSRPELINDVSQMSIKKTKIFSIGPVGFEEPPKEMKKEFFD